MLVGGVFADDKVYGCFDCVNYLGVIVDCFVYGGEIVAFFSVTILMVMAIRE